MQGTKESEEVSCRDDTDVRVGAQKVGKNGGETLKQAEMRTESK